MLLLEYGYMKNNLVRLDGYHTHRDVADMSNLFYFHFVFISLRGTTRLLRSRLSKQNGINKNWYKNFSQPGETKLIRMHMYQFKLTKSQAYIYHAIRNMCLVCKMKQALHKHKNMLSHLLSQPAYRDFLFHLNTQLESDKWVLLILVTTLLSLRDLGPVKVEI